MKETCGAADRATGGAKVATDPAAAAATDKGGDAEVAPAGADASTGAGAGAGSGAGADSGDGKGGDDGNNAATTTTKGYDFEGPSKDALAGVDADLVRYTIQLLVAAIVRFPALLAELYAVPDLSSAFVFGLLETGEEKLRKAVSAGVLSMCNTLTRTVIDAAATGDGAAATKALDTPRKYFLHMLMREVDHAYDYAAQCNEFFLLLRQIVRTSHNSTSVSKNAGADGKDGKDGGDTVDAEDTTPTTKTSTKNLDLGGLDAREVILSLCDKIRKHPVTESTPEEQDRVLCGLLWLLGSVLSGRYPLKEEAGITAGMLE